jgi:hypothetical protein
MDCKIVGERRVSKRLLVGFYIGRGGENTAVEKVKRMDENANIATRGKALGRAPKGLRQKLERMLAGVTGALPQVTTLTTPAGSVPKSEVIARLAAGVARYETIDAQLIALKQARQLLLVEATALQQDYNDLKDSIAAVVGRRNPLIAQFGMKPQRPRQPLTPEQRVIRAAKVRATRRLRHTAGRRQKAALRYQGAVDVTATLVTLPPRPPEAATQEVPPAASDELNSS